jgi:hypothetical protein
MKRFTPCTLFCTALMLSFISATAFAKDPDCTHREAWPSGMAFTQLGNAGLVKPGEVDAAKTVVTRLASEKLRKNRYRQVHWVKFTKLSGEELSAITVNEVSHHECSESGVDVYLISKRYGDAPLK